MGVRPQQTREAGASPRGTPSTREAAYLAEASRLLANSLDYETTLSTVAGLALPDLGAWCIVDVTEENGDIRRLAVVHPDPDKQALARELRDGWPPTRQDPVGVPAVARTLEPEVVSVDDRMLQDMARSPRNLEIMRRLGIGSLMSVPLTARGQVLGAITFVSDPAEDAYHDSDLVLAEDLANRAAIAIDNARLYRTAQRARQDAEIASRAKGQFLGVMSHELRTPINAILGYTQLLDMGIKGSVDEEQRELLARIDASGRHLLELVSRVLDVARAEAGELTVSNEVHTVHEILESTLRLARRDAPENAAIDAEYDRDHALTFFGDGIRTRQILVHLVANAVRFTRGSGTVTVRCHPVPDGAPTAPPGAGPWVRFDIEDQGMGIPEHRLEDIFEPFVQGDPAGLTRETDGSGLGLAVARQLARLMGGDLTVVSQPGVGSTFSLWLTAPRRDADRERRAISERDDRALPALAEHLLRRMKPILDTYLHRLRHDSAIPRAAEASEAELNDHIPHFLAGLASILAYAGNGSEAPRVMREGSTLQRTTLELHGEQRRLMAWSRAALERDLDLLRRTIHRDVRLAAPDLHGTHALDALDRLFEQAQHVSLQGWATADARARPSANAEPGSDVDPLPSPGQGT